MKKKYMLLSLMSMLGIGMQAQTAYTYVKQDGNTVIADGVAGFDISSNNAVMSFDASGNAIMEIDGVTVAKLTAGEIADGGVLTSNFTTEEKPSAITSTEGITANVGTAGYASLYSPFQLKMPAESTVSVYAPTYSKGKLTLTGNEIATDAIIPAGTGLVLKNAERSITFTFSDKTSTATAGDLTGSAIELTNPTPSTEEIYTNRSFVLGKSAAGVVAFYEYVGETFDAGKAYVIAPYSEAQKANNAKAVFFDNGNSTDIESIDSKMPTVRESIVYNILGQRVNAKAKGLVIINGKKYLNK